MPGTITGAVTSPDSHIRASAGLRDAERSFPATGNKGLVAGALACAFLAFGAASQGVVASGFFLIAYLPWCWRGRRRRRRTEISPQSEDGDEHQLRADEPTVQRRSSEVSHESAMSLKRDISQAKSLKF